MKLTFNSIEMHNFFSYEDASLSLKDMGFSIVSGVNNSDSDGALSNGSGKSSIFNAICYALTGETAQGLKNNIENIHGDPTNCWVKLDFDVDNKNFIIQRFKTPHTNLKIILNGQDISGKGIKESTKILSDYLPDLTSMLVGSIIILGQGLPYRFTNNTPSGRKDLLEKLTKSDYMIQAIKDSLDSRQTDLKLELRKNEDLLVSKSTLRDVYLKRLEEFIKDLQNYSKYDNSLNILDSEINQVKNEISQCLSLVEKCDIDKQNLLKEFKRLNDDKDNFTLNHKLESDKLTIDIDNDLKKLLSDKSMLVAKISLLKSEIARLDSITDICPTCGQKIPNVQKIDTSDKLIDLKNLEDSLIAIIKGQEELDKKREEIIAKVTTDFSLRLSEYNSKISDYQAKISNIDAELSSNNSKYQALLKEDLRLSNIKENYTKLLDNLAEIRKNILDNDKEISKLDDCVADTNDHLAAVQSLITLAKREFRGVLLDNVIKYMNSKIKQYSQLVFNNDLLSFTLNENYIDIMFDGKYYEALSGGEKQKVDIIIQLALRELLSNTLGLHTNLLVCDEVFDNLDNSGCQSIIKLISNLNDIDSIFVISHHTTDLQISYDSEVVVTKDKNGISSIIVH